MVILIMAFIPLEIIKQKLNKQSLKLYNKS